MLDNLHELLATIFADALMAARIENAVLRSIEANDALAVALILSWHLQHIDNEVVFLALAFLGGLFLIIDFSLFLLHAIGPRPNLINLPLTHFVNVS